MCGKCSIKLFLVLLFLFCGCYKTGFHNLDPIEQQKYITDIRSHSHEYYDFTPLFHQENNILYCKLHFGWEVITAMYNPKKDKYDYMVARHKKF